MLLNLSNDFPFVSGTNTKTNTTAINARIPYNQNVPVVNKVLTRKAKVLVMTKEHSQLNAVATPLAVPRAFTGKTSLIRSQGMGPHDMANPTM